MKWKTPYIFNAEGEYLKPKEKLERYFLVGGFLSGSSFPVVDSKYPSFTGIKESGADYREYTLNNQHLNLLDMLSIPLLYAKTRSECSGKSKLIELQVQLFEYQPTIIICHSLGCYFMDELYRQGFVFPTSIKEIRYVQADVSKIMNPDVINYCSWQDPVLHAAKIANLRFGLNSDAGLFGDPNHSNNRNEHPDLLAKHTGLYIVDWHLDSLNSMTK